MVETTDGHLRKESLIANLIGTAVGTFLIGALGLGISRVFGLTGNQQLMAAGVTLLLGLLLTLFFFLRVLSLLDRVGLRYMSRRTGIIDTFPRLTDPRCKQDMQEQFARAKDIRLLLQIGRQELGFSRPSYFYSLALEKDASCQIRILRASAESPFFSEARAKLLVKDPKRWSEYIKQLAREIGYLRKQSRAQIEDRQHCEPYLWRIFIFDKIAYVSAYRKLTNNDSEATVYKLTEAGEDSLYFDFSKYFDYLWRKYDPQGPKDANERWEKWR